MQNVRRRTRLRFPSHGQKPRLTGLLVLTSLPMNIPLIPLSVSLNWRSKDKDEPKAPLAPSVPQAAITDREFLFMLAIVIVLSGALVIVTGMALAHAARR